MANALLKNVETVKRAILSEFNPYLAGNFAPVHDELDVDDLPVVGEIPKELIGIYMRNGPNPEFPPIAYAFPWDGDGMIHAVYLADGKAHYRNRYVLTRALLKERRAGKALYGSALHPRPIADPEWADPEDEPVAVKNGAHIHIIRHAGKYLAMSESNCGYEVTKDLKTLGEWDPSRTGWPIHVSPHTRLDPLTGDLWLVNYNAINPPYLTVYHIDHKGDVAHHWDIHKPYPSLIHDFVLTEHYAVIFVCPLVADVKGAMRGGLALAWRPELGTQIGVMPRSGGNLQWLETDPFFAFHFANGYEDQGDIVIDYPRYEQVTFLTEKTDDNPTLHRAIINPKLGTVRHTQVDDRITEFPRIKEDRNTLPHQFSYLLTRTPALAKHKASAGLDITQYHAVVKYDMKAQRDEVHEFGKNAEVEEAVFAPRVDPASEDDGYLMCFVYDRATKQTDFVILDAKNIGDKPVGRVKMPRRVPRGVHGSWMSGPWEG